MSDESFSDKFAKVPLIGGLLYAKPAEQKAPPAQPLPTPPVRPAVVMTAPQATTTVDPASPQVRKYFSGLADLMKPVSSSGYVAFQQQMAALGAIIKDDATLIPAAAAAAGGVSPGEIDHEIQDCLDVISQQEGNFNTALQKKVTAEVGEKQAAITQTEQEIAALEAKMKELRARRDALAGDVQTVQQTAETERACFEEARTQHTATLTALRDRVRRNLQQPTGGGTT